MPLSGPNLNLLSSIGSSAEAPMLIRIFKQSADWRYGAGLRRLVSAHENLCHLHWSGNLGPKIAEGDRQAPEGFYTVTPGLMNPKSALYLSFKIGRTWRFVPASLNRRLVGLVPDGADREFLLRNLAGKPRMSQPSTTKRAVAA